MSDDKQRYIEIKDTDNNSILIPVYVVEFLIDLREQDLKELHDSVEVIQNVKRGGRFLKFAAITIFVTVTSIVAFGNTIIEAKKIIVGLFTGT